MFWRKVNKFIWGDSRISYRNYEIVYYFTLDNVLYRYIYTYIYWREIFDGKDIWCT